MFLFLIFFPFIFDFNFYRMFLGRLNVISLFVIVFLIVLFIFIFMLPFPVLFSFFYLYCFFNLYLLYVLVYDNDLYNLKCQLQP